ncbi:hypothetical protein IGI04_009764 [Brassica rapa subsp. trilocularis]|uniref:Zinc finger GRF-type domain-containing protein n=1 Tax=Brassica rapa subsp. trilocularis TaxID=1813537 RepID=A0ABQ7N0R4_BRACM|nr:hypothetical protein IGI04_009764 [Brassica rapa subsp. trilocularis]
MGDVAERDWTEERLCLVLAKKKPHFDESKEKKKPLNSPRRFVGSHHRDSTPSDPQGKLTKMGRYSYSQQSSSSASVDITSLLEAEAQGYADEAQSSFDNGEPFQNQPQPEGDDGIPTICYCGSEPVVATAYTEKDSGRRYFTCNNVVDGATHIWKWWDDAVMEEMRDFQTEIRRLKEAVAEREQKLLLLEKTVYDAGKDTTRVKLMVCLLVVIGLVILVLHGVASKTSMGSVLSPVQWRKNQIPVDLESPEPFWLGSQAPDDSPSEISPECPSQIPPECPSQVPEENVVGEDEHRPVGVKAAKGASKKKKSGRDEELSKLQGVLELTCILFRLLLFLHAFCSLSSLAS